MSFINVAKNTLNKEQIEAVKDIYGPQLILAGAGTGKTKTLVNKVAYLISEGIAPESILLLTFTRKAAKEMIDRASKILKKKCKVSGGTFHSFANNTLRKYANLIGFSNNFTILDSGDSESYINAIRNYSIEEHKTKTKYLPKGSTIAKIISKKNNTGQSVLDIIYEEYPQYLEKQNEKEIERDIFLIEKNYKSLKKEANAMDYDDLLVYLKDLLTKNEKVRNDLSNTYQYILVDEFQDTNELQSYISCLLASNHGNITVVGDDCQTIYSWRGACHKNIIDFPQIFGKEKTKVHYLTQNYRSNDKILDLSNGIIDILKEKHEKHLYTEKITEKKPFFVKLKNDDEEAEFICREIIKLRENGLNLNNIAILFRSGFHSFRLEIKLKSYNIPFIKYGGLKFNELAHIKDLIAILKVMHNPKDFISMYRVLNLIDGIGDKTSLKIIEGVKNNGTKHLKTKQYKNKTFYSDMIKLHKILSTESIIGCEKHIKKGFSFYKKFFEIKYEDFHSREGDLQEFINMGKGYNNISEFLNDIAIDGTPKEKVGKTGEGDTNDEKVILSTIHSAKGLERNTVFVIHLVDGKFPSSRSIKAKQLEEEKRLLYVALTRAKNNLYITSYHGFNENSFMSSNSRFLDEIDDFSDLVKNVEFQNNENNHNTETYSSKNKSTGGYLKSINTFFGNQ